MRNRITALIAAAASIGATGASHAALTFTGSGNGISASATFTDLGGGNLQIQLVNTYTGDTPDQSHVLTAVFLSGMNGLHPVSAILPSGSQVWTDHSSVAAGGLNVGGEWAYLSGLSGVPGGGSAGISSSGFNWFGNGNFNGPNIDPPPNGALDGSGYGIISSGYAGLALDGLAGRSYAQNSVVFTLSGFTGKLSDISNVTFQYGTTTGEPFLTGTTSIPESNFSRASLMFMLPVAASIFLRKNRAAVAEG
jgi:hypothetical protein